MTQGGDPGAGWRLRVFESLPSTSDLCRDMAAAGETEGLAVLARRQTAGRGSRGRAWQDGLGNLHFSVLLRPREPARMAGHYALLAGVAVADVLDRPDIALKWPNDVLLGGAKLGGILVDCAQQDGIFLWLVIGIGLNLAAAPQGLDRQVACLDGALAPEDVALRLLDRLAHWQGVVAAQGWAKLREAWLAHALPAGTAMTLRLGEQSIGGRFAGLAEDGGLLLETPSGTRHFTAGEIWLPTTETHPC